MNEAIKYNGEWQTKSTIRQKLEGPTGDGSVDFQNGDKFEGEFFLHFSSINGPCYIAKGKYTFADGKYIDHAWINTSDNLAMFALIGVYEVYNANGTLSSISSFYNNERHGIEVIIGEKPMAIEWYRGEELEHYNVLEYLLEKIDNERRILWVSLENNLFIKIISGCLRESRPGTYTFKNYLEGCILYPNGNIYTSVNYGIRNLEAYDGWGTRHTKATGMCCDIKYKEGNAVESKNEEHSMLLASQHTIPHPTNSNT